jgi:hypothetical protein
MIPDPVVIAELRSLFKSGATPSRLMGQIIAHHEQQSLPATNKLIRAYFREAFGIPTIRISADLLSQELEGLRIAHASAEVIHQLVLRRSEWDASSEETWMDSFTIDDATKLPTPAPLESSNQFSEALSHVDDKTRQYLKDLVGYSESLSQKVAILSTLAERLQQQVSRLENNLNAERNAVPSPSSQLNSLSPLPSCGE